MRSAWLGRVVLALAFVPVILVGLLLGVVYGFGWAVYLVCTWVNPGWRRSLE